MASTNPIEILPFQLNYDGPAPIQTFFLVESKKKFEDKATENSKDDRKINQVEEAKEEEDEEFIAHFRGRRLIGKQINLPPNYQAIHAIVGSKTSSTEGKLEVCQSYQHLRIWQHDYPPEQLENNLQECFDWMEIATAVRETFHFLFYRFCLLFFIASFG